MRTPGLIAERLEIHSAPKHDSLLDMAETELSVLRADLAKRIVLCDTAKIHVAA